jgi:zinc protease
VNTTYKKTTLPNGLLVLLKEIHNAPLISSWMWYRVGSRDEVPGFTGISHWVEHMKFKSTDKFPAGVLDKTISRNGGYWNALTSLDWTTYYMTLPNNQIDLALSIESDHIANCSFDPLDVETERGVIVSERLGDENSPVFQLSESIQNTAFHVHSYRHKTIGDLVDLQSIKRDDLYAHYKTYYKPSNACLAIAGDFETNSIMDLVRQHFEKIPPGAPVKRNIQREPTQRAERTVVIEGTGAITYIQFSFHAPEASNSDFYPFVVLDSLLTGPSGLNPFGSGLSNITSQLYKTLVNTDVAVHVSGRLSATIDPYIYNLLVIPHPNSEANQVRKVIENEIHKLQNNFVPKAAIERAIKQARALFAYDSESITNQAFWLGYSEMFSSYEWFLGYLDKLAKVTVEDVQQCAKKYLHLQNCTVGIYRPK